ncbi:cupin domain-containing protein [Agaribacterium sp. ZY112]|uniref:cupin domain-containing protein n=1 Tax=Agaribacterium sp. ZY112 TaxID=3233574 RepID=UPI003524EF36
MATHILLSEKTGDSFLSSAAAPEFDSTDFPEGWSGMGLEASGVFMFVLKVAAGADEFDIHASEDAWLAYVASGSGSLSAGTADMKATQSLSYKEGDFITFDANTPHGWVNDNSESRLLFVKQA